MARYQPKLVRPSVRDSFDDDDPSDLDDEVFIRDGKHGILKIDDDNGLKRPLMAPRKKPKVTHFTESSSSSSTSNYQHLPYKTLFMPFLYTLIGLAVILALITLCILAITEFPEPLNQVRNWLSSSQLDLDSSKLVNSKIAYERSHLVPCTSLSSKIQWIRTFPKLTSEAPLRSNDVNADGIQDVILGFGSGLDRPNSLDYACTLYFDQSAPCLGGVMAIDGKIGETIWTHYTQHAIFSIECTLDLTRDSINDCLIAGRGGLLQAIDAKDGSLIWEYKDLTSLVEPGNNYYDTYDARFIEDVDHDGYGDVMASHTWQADKSEIILLSGKTGAKLQSLDLSTKEEIFVAPQTIVHPDGETYFILTASDESKSGGLYIIPRSKLLLGEFRLQEIYHGKGRGVNLPPVLVDVNSDGIDDIILTVFNSSVVAFDGLSFKEIWNFTVPNSEIISMPIPGYYNDDDVPDIMVKNQIGPGFPVYYYTEVMVLDGKTGKALLENPIRDTMSAQMSGISVTVDNYGNDWFLHWSSDCLGHEGSKDGYNFYKVEETADIDLCRYRFNSTLVSTLYAFNQHVAPPGIPVYRSEDWKSIEFNNTIDNKKKANSNYEGLENVGEEIVSNTYRKKDNEGTYYPRSKNVRYDNNGNEQHEKFLNNLETLSDLRQTGNGRPEDNMYEDDDDEEENNDFDDEQQRLLEARQLSEIRYQRSENKKGEGMRIINNDTNDVENTLDPSMDYTNGQSKRHNYYSTLNINRTSNLDDSSDYMNIPDIDFVDNIKDAEALSDRRRKRKVNNSVVKLFDSYVKSTQKRDNKRPYYQIDTSTGMHRQPPTGILLPPLERNSQPDKNPIDLVFSTYWLPTKSVPFIILPKDLECIEKMENQMGDRILSSDEREIIVNNCLSRRNVNYRNYDNDEEEMNRERNFQVMLGQLTLYRMQLKCVCPEDMLSGQSCKDISKKQSWPAHLGATGNGYFLPFRPM